MKDSTNPISRLSVLTVLMLALIPLGSYALLDPNVRQGATEALQRALDSGDEAQKTFKAERRAYQRRLDQKELKLREIAREKRQVRLHIAALRSALADLLEHGIDVSNPESAVALLETEKDNMRSFVRYLHSQRLTQQEFGPEMGGLIVRRLMFASLGDVVDMEMRGQALETARTRLLALVLDAQEMPITLAALEKRHAELLAEYNQEQKQHDQITYDIKLTNDQLSSVKSEFDQVQSQIWSLQAQLERIDIQLKNKIEKDLIAKGLRSEESAAQRKDRDQTFSWPVIGRISAGFFDAAYKRYFGIPHHGIDIVVSQGSPVRSAGHGVVLLARNGGMGYSYIIVGHRGGYATLYGHLSGINVSTGMEVSKGQIIGQSGGRPGSPGAGLMTTGSHLHFEVIKNGQKINPRSVLP